MTPSNPIVTLTDADNGEPLDVDLAAIGMVRVFSTRRTELTMGWGEKLEVRETRERIHQLRKIYGLPPPSDPMHP